MAWCQQLFRFRTHAYVYVYVYIDSLCMRLFILLKMGGKSNGNWGGLPHAFIEILAIRIQVWEYVSMYVFKVVIRTNFGKFCEWAISMTLKIFEYEKTLCSMVEIKSFLLIELSYVFLFSSLYTLFNTTCLQNNYQSCSYTI